MKKKLILFVFLLGSLLASIGQAQAQCTDCDFEVASTGGSNTLTLAANSVTCITNDVIFSDISWANGATLCIAPGKTLTIQNNMHNNTSTFNLNLEVYGTLAMGNPEFNFNMTMNIHPDGVFKTTGNAAFKGEDVTINNNQGNFQVSVLNLNGNSGKINILNSDSAYFYVNENINVGNNVKLVYNNKGTLTIGGQFGISPSSSFSNCGVIRTAGFNLMGGKIYNSGGEFLITSHLDGSGEVHNYATIEIEKIQGNSKNIYNYGEIKVSSSSIVDMAIYGPTDANSYGEFRWEGQASGVNNIYVYNNQIFKNTAVDGESSESGMSSNSDAFKPQTGANIVWGKCEDCIVGQDNPACIDAETGEPEDNLNIIVVQYVIGEIIANDDANSAPIGIAMTGSVKANDNWGSEDKNPKITEASVTINGVTTNLTLGASTSIPGAGEITLYTDGSYTYTSDVIGTIPVVYTVKNDDGSEDRATLYLTALNDCMDKVLFFEDFGTSDKDDSHFGRKTSPYMPSGSFAFGTPYPQSTIYDEYEIDNNHYAVVAPGYIKLGVDPNQYYFWTPAYNETGTVTDRSGTENGAVMVINAGSTLDAFYQRKINVVAGESYRASFWLYLVNGPSQVSIDIMNPSTKEVLAVMTSPEMEDWDTTYKGKWTNFELYFTVPADLECEIDELLLSFRNNKSADHGNDYYVDDIKLEQVCEVPDGTPTVDVKCPTYTVSIKAIDDFYEVGNNSSVDGNILDNDYGDDGDVLTVTEVVVDGQTIPIVVGGTEFTTKEGGKAKVYPDGTIEYTPPAGNNGFIDIFDYQVCNQVDFCATAEVHIAVGVCAIGQVGNDFGWSGGDNIVTKTITQPATDYGYTFDIYELDNSFNMLINGTLLAQQEIEFQSSASATQNIRFADGTKWEADGIPGVWDIKGDKAKNMPVIRVNIFYTGKVTMYASKVSADDPNYKLEVLELYNGNKFNNITYYIAGNDENEITVTQSVIGATVMDGRGYGRHRIENCPNYWHGTTDSDWSKRENWTDNLVPNNLEDVEFATAANNSYITDVGSSGAGNAQGEALRDLHLDTDRKIKDLINDSDMDLWVTTENKLEIHGEVKDNNPDAGTIVVKADEDEATGTLIFSKPELNTEVEAKVEFINLADECADCGFYKRNWQYFGIPVDGGAFPFNNPLLDGEMVRRWDEPTNGDKWLPVATESMIPFRGYEITSKVTAPKYEFEGTLNVGDKNIVLSKTPGVNYSGMNLLANSYTAAIPISAEAITNSTSALVTDAIGEATVYLFNRGTRDQWRKTNGGTVTGIAGGQYTAVPINLAGQATLPDRILSMHSFMVNAASDEAQISLKYDQLVKNETGTNQPAWRSADNTGKRELPYIVLDVIGEGSADRVWLFEESSTTRGYDNGWDGHKMMEGDLIQVFATDADQNKYQVTTVPQLDNTTLGIAARENESYTISVSTAADVENRRLYLHDTFTGRGYLLKDGAEMIIPGTRSANQNRFKITASNVPAAVTEASTINTYVRDNVIVVENRSNENATVSVYDISGRFVGKAQIAKDEIKSFAELSVGTGVKVVKVVSDSGSINRSDRVLLK